MWKKHLENILENCEFNEPAQSTKIEEIQTVFNIELPNELLSLLEETDGVRDEFGCDLVWSAGRIIGENKELRKEEFRDLYMPLDCLLFVADAGNGDLFGYAIINGSIQRDDIYVWNHEDDSRTWVAPSLKKFIEWWNDGTIKV
ncbi:SMI1/KNR4 family protein [Brevibacillus migulae]|uniref:SMI1/KNR4 family protein n=1 Tax=Brevibacillus migulae TaxID=1644114 RepID=UPI00106F01F2|nr:SMI1/KNR4 family protein [Brevibacillus migulae]